MRRESNFIVTWNLQKFEKSFQICPLLDRSCQSTSRPVRHSFEPTSLLSPSEGNPFRARSSQCRSHRPRPAVGFLTLECLGGNRVLRALLHHVLPILLSQLLFKILFASISVCDLCLKGRVPRLSTVLWGWSEQLWEKESCHAPHFN